MMIAPAVALLVFAAVSPVEHSDIQHSAEIEVFANAMAIARLAKTTCAGIVPDERHLDALRLRLHIAEADHAEFAFDAHGATALLEQRLAKAPSRQIWCDAVMRLYGPAGSLLPNLMRRLSGER